MVYTQLADRKSKLTAARKQIKYCMSFKCVLTCGFPARIVMISPMKSNFTDPKKWGIFIGKGASVDYEIFNFMGPHRIIWPDFSKGVSHLFQLTKKRICSYLNC